MKQNMRISSYIYLSNTAPTDLAQLWAKPVGNDTYSLHIFNNGAWRPLIGSGSPSEGEDNVIETVKVNGTALTPSNKAVNIPLATASADGVMSKEDKAALDSVSTTYQKKSTLGTDVANALANSQVQVSRLDVANDIQAKDINATDSLKLNGKDVLTEDSQRVTDVTIDQTYDDKVVLSWDGEGSVGGRDETILAATSTKAGVMSAADKSALDAVPTTYETKANATTKQTAANNAIAALQSQVAEVTGVKNANFGGVVAAATDIATDYTAKGYTGSYLYMVGSDMASLVAYQYSGSGEPVQLFSGATYDFTDYSDVLTQIAAVQTQLATIGPKIDQNKADIAALQEEVVEVGARAGSYDHIPLLGGQPMILFGSGAPVEANVPDNWIGFGDGGFEWIGTPSMMGQQYIDTTNGEKYVSIKNGFTLAWLKV